MPRAVGLPQAAAEELSAYWADSFGNSTRIDYGTGHETTFAALLFCLAKLGALSEGCLQVRAPPACIPRSLRTVPAGGRRLLRHGLWPPYCADCGVQGVCKVPESDASPADNVLVRLPCLPACPPACLPP